MTPALLAALLAAGAPPGSREPGRAAIVPGRVTIVACAPGYPGSTAEAQPAMDAFAAAVARAAGLPPGAVAAVYHSTEKEGLARLAERDAVAALIPLPFFLKHQGKLGLSPRLQVEATGGELREVWSLAARKGRVAGPSALAGFTVSSVAGYAPDFVRAALGAWGRLPESARVVDSGQVLSALRRAAAGAEVAVLLDAAQAAALPTLPFAGDLEVVARSEPLPAALVATVRGRLDAARWRAIEQALLGLSGDPQTAGALEGIRVVRFVRADAAAVAAARRLVARPAP